MSEATSLSSRTLEVLRQDGVSGVARQGVLYLMRRLAWRSTEWSNSLDITLLRGRLLRDFGPLLERNEVFRNRHQGQRCFVIGNGPSLKTQDLAPLANEITLVTNTFHIHPLVGDNWQPSYYFLSDPQYFEGLGFIDDLTAIPAQIPSAPFFVPTFAHKFLTENRVLPQDRTYYVAAGGTRLDDQLERPDFTTVTPGMQTVVQLAIMGAMFMGCSPIYLMGLDHDWLSHGGQDLHFYSEEEADSQPDGHVGPWTYLSLMGAMTTMWEVYVMLRKVAAKNQIEIVNCTNGGFLDVFKRARYEDVMDEKL